MSAVWWSRACVGYLGKSSRNGLEWRRHDALCNARAHAQWKAQRFGEQR